MTGDNIIDALSVAFGNAKKLLEDTMEQLTSDAAEARRSASKPESPLAPTPGYLPKLGDVVRFRHPRTGRVERARVTDIYDGPGSLSVRTVSDTYATVPWDKCELVEDLGFKPTPEYTPNMGDKVRVLDRKGFVHTGYVTQIHQNYKSAKVAIGTLESVTDQVTQAWKCLELIERNEFGEEPHEEPLEPVAKGRLESELDDSLDSQIPQPKDEPVVGAYGSVQAYEDLKTYYESRLEQAQSDAQKVSQQYNDFVAKVAQELGFSNPASATTRDVMDFIRHTNRHFSVIRDVRKRLNGLLSDREDLLEP
jgi:hypothetical protein